MCLCICAYLVSAVIGITVEPPPAHLTVKMITHDGFRSALDNVARAIAMPFQAATRTTTPLPPQLAYYVKQAISPASIVTASDYYADAPSVAINHRPAAGVSAAASSISTSSASSTSFGHHHQQQPQHFTHLPSKARPHKQHPHHADSDQQQQQQQLRHITIAAAPARQAASLFESDVKAVMDSPNTRIIVHGYSPMPATYHRLMPMVLTSQQRFPAAEHFFIRAVEVPSSSQAGAATASSQRQQRFGFRPNYSSSSTTHIRPSNYISASFPPTQHFLRGHHLVPATNPPPAPNDPPPPKPAFVYATTYQIDQQLRKYREQQHVDQRSPKAADPTTLLYRNNAMQEVAAPNLRIRERPLREQITRLKEQQHQHFHIDDDEHPAAGYSGTHQQQQYNGFKQHQVQPHPPELQQHQHYDQPQQHLYTNSPIEFSKLPVQPSQPSFTNAIDPTETNYKHNSYAKERGQKKKKKVQQYEHEQNEFKPSPLISSGKVINNDFDEKPTYIPPATESPSLLPLFEPNLQTEPTPTRSSSSSSPDYGPFLSKMKTKRRPAMLKIIKRKKITTTTTSTTTTSSPSDDYESVRDSPLNAEPGLSAYRTITNNDMHHYNPLKFHSDPYEDKYTPANHKSNAAADNENDDTDTNDHKSGRNNVLKYSNHQINYNNHNLKNHRDDDEAAHDESDDNTDDDRSDDDRDDDDDNISSDESATAHSDFDFRRIQRTAPQFIKPVQYAMFIERSSAGGSTTDKQRQSGETGKENDSEIVAEEFVPFRMLASLRRTERFQHRPRSIADAVGPTIREKVHEEGGHIVYTEQGYQDEQFDHGNEEHSGAYKEIRPSLPDDRKRKIRRKRSSTNDTDKRRNFAAFPFYLAPANRVPELSPLRYSSTEARRAAQRAGRFYETRSAVDCANIDFDDQSVTPDNEDDDNDFTGKRRLHGLGGKLECLRRKYFGADPFANPIFQERLVSDQTVPYRVRRQAALPAFAGRRVSVTASPEPPVVPSAAHSSQFLADNGIGHHHDGVGGTSTAAALVQTLPRPHDTPTVILLNERAMARVRANPTMPLSDMLRFPEVEQSEVFIFDIAKFVPRLFMQTDETAVNNNIGVNAVHNGATASAQQPSSSASWRGLTSSSSASSSSSVPQKPSTTITPPPRLNSRLKVTATSLTDSAAAYDAARARNKLLRTPVKKRRTNHNFTKAVSK